MEFNLSKRVKNKDQHDEVENEMEITIFIIPSEIIRFIFSMIQPNDWPNISLTCKKFYDYGSAGFNHKLNNNYVLFYSCCDGNYKFVKKLLTSRNDTVDPNCWWEEEDIGEDEPVTGSPITESSERGYHRIVELLLRDTRIRSEDVTQAIIDVSYYGFCKVIKLLLNDPRTDPSGANDALIIASEGGKYNAVKLLLESPKVDPSFDKNQAIIKASEFGHHDIVRLLMEDPRVNPADQDNAAIIVASEYGRHEVVKLLLRDPRVDPSFENSAAYRLALKNKCEKVLKVLSNDHRIVSYIKNAT